MAIDPTTGYPVVPHEFVADVNCCGCLIVEPEGNLARIICNECGALIRTVPAAEVPAVLEQMLMSTGQGCSARCQHCDALNTFPGFSSIEAFICSECGEGNVMGRSWPTPRLIQCGEKERLLADYKRAEETLAALESWAGALLGDCSEQERELLASVTETVRVRMAEARLRLDRHVADHNC
jgi:hypothetical protein